MESVPSIGDFWKILLLRDDALMTIRRSRGGFSLSLRLFLLAGLIASIGVLAGGLAQAGRTTTSDRLQAAAASVTQAASGPWMKYLPRLSAGLVALSDRLNGAATAVESVQPPLGSRTSQAIRAFGAWASQPFLSLAAWLAGILPFVLAARLLGGQGTLRQQVSLLLLAFLPQALLFPLSFVAVPVGSLAALVSALRIGAGLWSLAIFLAGMAVANAFARMQAAKVVAVTMIVLVILSTVAGLLIDRWGGPILTLLLG